MENLTINKNSVIAPIITSKIYTECARLRSLARKETVEVHFFDDYVRIVGRKSRKIKVPAKVIGSPEVFISWVENKIKTAW